MMDKIVEKLGKYDTAVLNFVDAKGFPYSVRIQPKIDRASETIGFDIFDGAPVAPGPASLIAHYHDENLWNQTSFGVRGELVEQDGGLVFRPKQLFPAPDGILSLIRFLRKASATAKRYLDKRGLGRPKPDFAKLNAIWEETKKPIDPNA